jgi:hypothetical protein
MLGLSQVFICGDVHAEIEENFPEQQPDLNNF